MVSGLKKTKGEYMKKIIMAAICSLMVGASIAGDVYDLRLVCKMPVIGRAKLFYKDFKTVRYRGFINVEYDANGTIISPSDAVIYGVFAEGKAKRDMKIDLNVSNIYGKKWDRVEMNIDCQSPTMALTLAGIGNCKITSINGCNSCSESVDCTKTIKIYSVSGNFTGAVTDVLCGPCDDKPWTLVFNSCASEMLIPGNIDVIFGSWKMKYNKSLSAKCSEVGFLECISNILP